MRTRVLLAFLASAAIAAPVRIYAQAVSPDPAIAAQQVPTAREPRLSEPRLTSLLRQKVKYVFVIYQENRSFDSYFGTFPGVDGLFSRPASQTLGFDQPLINTDGTMGTVHPFRIGPREYAADTDDIDHSHALTIAKMDVQGAAPVAPIPRGFPSPRCRSTARSSLPRRHPAGDAGR